MTSAKLTPPAAASDRQTSYSGVNRAEPVRQIAILPVTAPHAVSPHATDGRAPFSGPSFGAPPTSVFQQTKSLPTDRRPLAAACTLISTPGRPFFIWIGVSVTSRAPARPRRSAQCPTATPDTSSRFVSSTTIDSIRGCLSSIVVPAAVASPIKVRNRFGWSKSF